LACQIQPELNACYRLLEQVKRVIVQADESVEGFNIGVNEGQPAGQPSSIATYTLSLVARATSKTLQEGCATLSRARGDIGNEPAGTNGAAVLGTA
jgi:hypothetical protein